MAFLSLVGFPPMAAGLRSAARACVLAAFRRPRLAVYIIVSQTIICATLGQTKAQNRSLHAKHVERNGQGTLHLRKLRKLHVFCWSTKRQGTQRNRSARDPGVTADFFFPPWENRISFSENRKKRTREAAASGLSATSGLQSFGPCEKKETFLVFAKNDLGIMKGSSTLELWKLWKDRGLGTDGGSPTLASPGIFGRREGKELPDDQRVERSQSCWVVSCQMGGDCCSAVVHVWQAT